MPSHLIILALVALIFFGPKRLPEIGRSLGTAMRGFREGLSGTDAPEHMNPQHDANALPQPQPQPPQHPST